MSVTGLACVFPAPLQLAADRPVVAHFAIPHGLRQFAIRCEVVHAGAGDEGDPVRLRFLPLSSPAAREEREKALWVFLLDEQRRDLRMRHWMA